MMKLRIIGDVHGKYNQYEAIIKDCERSIQVGDLGVGFGGVDPIFPPEHRFIRGNHDNPETCKKHPNWIPDGLIEANMMFIGGAWSIDHAFRTENVDWWSDEELSYNDLQLFIDKAILNRPEIMITHDVPASVTHMLFPWAQPFNTRTQQALDVILNAITPKLWIFGHWHHDIDKTIDNTRFICLNELSYLDMEVMNDG